MKIRKYLQEDAGEVSDFVVKNLLEVNTKDYDYSLMSSLATYYTPDAMTAASKEKEVFVGIEEDEIVATAAFLNDGWVHDVFIDPQRHRKGLGTIMMNYLEDLARSRGFRAVRLPSSITAVSFYNKLGYRKLREIVSEEGLTEVLMEKEL